MNKLPFVIFSQSVSHTFWSCLGAKIELFPDREKEERERETPQPRDDRQQDTRKCLMMRNEKRMRGTPPFSLHIPLRKVVIPGLNVFLIPLHHQHELGISFFLFLSERRRGKEWEERNEKKEERTRLNQRQHHHHHHHSILIQWLSFLSPFSREKVIPSFLSPFISNLHDLNSQIGFGLFLEKSHSLIHPHFLSLHHHNGIEERVLERESLNSLRILWMKRLP